MDKKQLSFVKKNLPKNQDEFKKIFSWLSLEESYKDSQSAEPENLPEGVGYLQYKIMKQAYDLAMLVNPNDKDASHADKKLSVEAIRTIWDRMYPKLQAIDTTVKIDTEQVLKLANGIADIITNNLKGDPKEDKIKAEIEKLISDVEPSNGNI